MRKGRKISGYLYKRGGRHGTWWVQWRSGGVVYRQTTGKTAKDEARVESERILSPFKAQEDADTLAAVVARMNHAETAAQAAVDLANRIELSEVWKRFPYSKSQPRRKGGAVRELSQRNVEENKRDWEKFVDWMRESHKEAKAMQDVTPKMAQGYSDFLFNRQRLTATRHNKLITTCGVMFRLAGVPSPFSNVTKYELPKEAEHREPFTVPQVEKLLTAATGEMRGLLATLYFTGLRAGDAVQLRHENRRDGKITVMTAKTRSHVDILEHPLLSKILGEVCGDVKRGPLFPLIADAYERNHTSLAQRFERVATLALGKDFCRTEKRAGRGQKAISRFGMHSFRHSLATHCARAGVPIGIVQKWLGHASASITRIYQHWSTADQQQVVNAIPMLALPGMSMGDVLEAETVEVENTVDLVAVRTLVESLTKKNVTEVKAHILAMLTGKAELLKEVEK